VSQYPEAVQPQVQEDLQIVQEGVHEEEVQEGVQEAEEGVQEGLREQLQLVQIMPHMPGMTGGPEMPDNMQRLH